MTRPSLGPFHPLTSSLSRGRPLAPSLAGSPWAGATCGGHRSPAGTSVKLRVALVYNTCLKTCTRLWKVRLSSDVQLLIERMV